MALKHVCYICRNMVEEKDLATNKNGDIMTLAEFGSHRMLVCNDCYDVSIGTKFVS